MRMRKSYYLLPGLLVPLFCFLVFGGCGHEKSTSELLEDLNSPHEKNRIVAVRSLQVRMDEAAQIVPSLINALKDRQPDIRLSAAIKLGLFGESANEAIPALQQRLNDGDARVREAAGIALTRIDPEKFPTPPKSAAGKGK
jgi:HEAT repeat protein